MHFKIFQKLSKKNTLLKMNSRVGTANFFDI